MHLNIHQYS